MKKTFKLIGITILSIIILAYLAFLFILPCLNINKYEPIIQKLVKEQTKLDLKYENARCHILHVIKVKLCYWPKPQKMQSH